ncbi:MAG: tRNA dihydrouridine synthase [Caulobacterales bacterium]
MTSLPASVNPAALTGTPIVMLAPMAGATDAPFRASAHRFGATYTVSEMVACEALANARPDMVRRTLGAKGIDPLVIQLAGRDPSWMARGAQLAADAGATVIDINMGCPAKVVTSGASGSALMREPDLALRLIEAVATASPVPVTVKMRLGWCAKTANAPEIAKRAESAGAALLVVHGRTRMQFFRDEANWAAIRETVRAVAVPVIANGDIRDVESARAALAASGAAGVMVGRAAQGRPWLPAEIAAGLSGRAFEPPRGPGVAEALWDLTEASLSFYGSNLGLRMARKHLAAAIDTCTAWLDQVARAQARRAICSMDDPQLVRRGLEAVFTIPDVARAA